jgi:hypothetical protein
MFTFSKYVVIMIQQMAQSTYAGRLGGSIDKIWMRLCRELPALRASTDEVLAAGLGRYGGGKLIKFVDFELWVPENKERINGCQGLLDGEC